MKEQFDVVFIGGGPGGYVGAIKAAQLGLKVACVEKRGSLGGTCLNVGCIPSKILLQSSELYEEANHGLAKHGIQCKGVSLDLATMMTRKTGLVADLCKGIEGLFKKNKITYYIGAASFTGPGALKITAADKSVIEIATKNAVIATGSEVMPLPGITIDEERIVSSTGALTLKAVPKEMIVIGGGYIGLEMGSVWRRLGAKVTVVEFLDVIVPAMDGETGKQLQKVLEKQGIGFKLGTKVTSAVVKGKGVELTVEPAKGGASEILKADVVLVSIGRRPYTAGLGLETLGISVDKGGRIEVDNHFRTSAAGVYAIGDVIRGPMLAHKAEEEGVAVAEILAGQSGHVNYDVIPGVVYTWPEVATVGKTEEELKQAGVAYKVGKFPFLANSRAKAIGSTDGFVKILTCAASDKVLGVHIIGPDAGTMIAEAVLAMEYSASAEDIARTCHAHPTLNEAMKEAALAASFGKAIHM
jgi:dihydrolipoamide dehydrogenase